MRLIDADVLLKYAGNCYDEDDHLLYAVGTGTIMRMPTIDAVQVVRCKDCKYMDENHLTCSVWESGTDYDGYCSYGERSSE